MLLGVKRSKLAIERWRAFPVRISRVAPLRWIQMFRKFCFVVLTLAWAGAPVWSAEKEKPALRPYDGSDGYYVLPGSISPDGAYALAIGPATSKPEELAKLAPWPADLALDPQKIDFGD